jgi:hypothetical protein
MARWLRAACYAAILAIMPASAAIQLFAGTAPRGGHDLHTFHVFQGPGAPGTSVGGPNVPSVVALLLFTACGLAAILALTARRTRVAPATLAIGAGAGLALGAAMYAVDPLGIDKYVTAPWLRGTMTDTVPDGRAQWLVALCWILLFGAPVIGALMGVVGAGVANALASPQPDGGRPPGPPGPPGPRPLPDPPDARRRADAEADQGRLRGRDDDGDGKGEGEGDQGLPGLVGAGLAHLP